MRFFTILGETVEFETFEPRSFVVDGDRVVVLGFEKCRVKQTGRQYETHWSHAFTLSGGEVTTFREYTDTAAIAAAYRV